MARTKMLKIFPIPSLYHGCLTARSDSAIALEPMVMSKSFCTKGSNFAISSIGVERSASVMSIRSFVEASMPRLTEKPFPLLVSFLMSLMPGNSEAAFMTSDSVASVLPSSTTIISKSFAGAVKYSRTRRSVMGSL